MRQGQLRATSTLVCPHCAIDMTVECSHTTPIILENDLLVVPTSLEMKGGKYL